MSEIKTVTTILIKGPDGVQPIMHNVTASPEAVDRELQEAKKADLPARFMMSAPEGAKQHKLFISKAEDVICFWGNEIEFMVKPSGKLVVPK
jgi:hypothetical protein